MEAGGGVRAGGRGVAAVDQVLPGQQTVPPEAGMKAGQGLAVRAGDDGGHVGDDVEALVVARLGRALSRPPPDNLCDGRTYGITGEAPNTRD